MIPKDLTICTGNKAKYKEYVESLMYHGLSNVEFIQKTLDFIEPKTISLRDVAIAKARQAYDTVRKPLLVDDAGLYISAYENFPGTYTKFAANTLGIPTVYKLALKSTSTLEFRLVLCYYDGLVMQCFEGSMLGSIKKLSGEKLNSLQYNDFFIPTTGPQKVLSEYTLGDRIKFSHRSQAIKKFVNWIKTC